MQGSEPGLDSGQHAIPHTEIHCRVGLTDEKRDRLFYRQGRCLATRNPAAQKTLHMRILNPPFLNWIGLEDGK